MHKRARSFAHFAVAALTLFLFAAGVAHAAPNFPPLAGRVVDDAGILSDQTREQLTELLAQHEQQTGNQVVVATVKSLDGYDIRDYGYQLGRAWGIGRKGKDNGVLILISMDPHQIDIEVGYGLEGTLTDVQSKLITENVMKPFFKQGNYDAGVLAGTVDVLRALGGKPSNVDSIPQPPVQQDQGSHGGHIPIFLIVVILWVVFGRFFWPLLFVGGMGGPWGGGGFGGGGFGGGSGGFGGGGFSGGGGSFGGGGASSSW